MKHILLFISLLILGSFNVFSQKGDNQIKKDTMPTSEYTNYGIKINFKGSIDIIKNNFDEESDYFEQSIEIIRFNENNIDYKGQQLTVQIQSLIYPDEVSRYSLEDTTENEPSSIENYMPKNETYSSLNNSFSYYIYFSSLYILPKMSRRKFKKEMASYVNKHPLFKITKPFTKIKIGNHKVYKWRFQNVKTRLDHYIFFGKKYNYLFVSSPYGNNGGIEEALLEMELLETKKNKK